MKREFWLLDLNYEPWEDKPAIWLWGITAENKRVLIVQDYQPYFYLLPGESQDPAELREKLEKEKPHPSIVSATVEQRKLLGTTRTVLRVSCSEVESLEKIARQAVKMLGVESSFEDGIRPASKYQTGLGVTPCHWYEVQVEEAEKP